jgi:ABC-type transport system substrate-binding protein
MGWHDEDYFKLVGEAARTSDRVKRMRMYRQADQFLVADQTLVLPLAYTHSDWVDLVKPWVKNFKMNPMGLIGFQYLVFEEH